MFCFVFVFFFLFCFFFFFSFFVSYFFVCLLRDRVLSFTHLFLSVLLFSEQCSILFSLSLSLSFFVWNAFEHCSSCRVSRIRANVWSAADDWTAGGRVLQGHFSLSRKSFGSGRNVFGHSTVSQSPDATSGIRLFAEEHYFSLSPPPGVFGAVLFGGRTSTSARGLCSPSFRGGPLRGGQARSVAVCLSASASSWHQRTTAKRSLSPPARSHALQPPLLSHSLQKRAARVSQRCARFGLLRLACARCW